MSCWLLCRHGRGCFRGAWETPRTRVWARAAGLALAAGLATAPAAAAADGPSSAATSSDESSSSEEAAQAAEPVSLLETALMRWNTRTLPDSGYHPFREQGIARDGDVPEPPADAADDPGWRFFEKVARGSLPRGFAGRMEAVRDALQTGERSLSLSALLFRTIAETVLDGRAPSRRGQDDRAALRETLSLLAERTETWRREIYERRLDPYLSAGRQHARHFFEMCKAYIPPPNWMRFSRDTAEELWGAEGTEAADDWLDAHSWGEALALTLTVEAGSLEIAREEATGISGTAIVAVTDVLTARAPAADDEGADDADGSAPISCSVASIDGAAWTVDLPADVELTWADVVRLAYEQNRQALNERAHQVVEAGWWGDRTADPFLLPALRSRHDDPNVAPWLVDFWMF